MEIEISGKMLLIVLISVAALYIYDRQKEKAIEKNRINEVMFISSNDPDQPSKISSFMKHLKSARYSLDICMFFLVNIEIVNEIVKLHQRGRRIRIILHGDIQTMSGQAFKLLMKRNIPMRWKMSVNIMHHKFCLIDASPNANVNVKPLLISGSMNWSSLCFSSNFEDFVVTNEERLVHPFKQEFERLWVNFKQNVD